MEDVTITVGAGEIVCVVGESGSGKSVTAQAVMGLLPRELNAAAGSVRLEGENVLAATPARLRALRGTRMAMIFQEPMTALNPVMTVGAQIAEVLEIHTPLSEPERRKRVLEVMRAVQLPEPERMIDVYPHQISGGQRQRIMIAAALVLDPALLIADEPTTALDVTTQAQILKLIRELQERRGTGVLFITHDFGVVADIAHRVVVMQAGRVVEAGTREEVLRRPRADYTRMLIAAVPSLDAAAAHAQERPNRARHAQALQVLRRRGAFYSGPAARCARQRTSTSRCAAARWSASSASSGSGKTTVARCIARLVEPTAGSIRIGDIDVARLPESRLRAHRKHVQIVFQDPYRSLNPRRTVGASIIEGPVNFGMSTDEADKRARELMRLVGLSPDALSRYPHQFSGGQRQRIAIARALAMEPQLLITDEAVSALDVSVQAQVLELLDDVRSRFDLAILFITHDLRVAAQICDRIAVMQHGIVVEQGPTAEVFGAPQHPYTRELFEAAPGRHAEFGRAAGAA